VCTFIDSKETPFYKLNGFLVGQLITYDQRFGGNPENCLKPTVALFRECCLHHWSCRAIAKCIWRIRPAYMSSYIWFLRYMASHIIRGLQLSDMDWILLHRTFSNMHTAKLKPNNVSPDPRAIACSFRAWEKEAKERATGGLRPQHILGLLRGTAGHLNTLKDLGWPQILTLNKNGTS